VTVRSPVRGHHVHVRFGYGNRVRDLWQHHGHAGSQHDAELLSRHQTESLVLLPVLVKMILITHIRSLINAWFLGRLHAYWIFYIHSTPDRCIGLRSVIATPGLL